MSRVMETKNCIHLTNSKYSQRIKHEAQLLKNHFFNSKVKFYWGIGITRTIYVTATTKAHVIDTYVCINNRKICKIT